MGVTLSVTSLVMALAQDKPEEYRGSYVKGALRLKKIVVDNDVAPGYLYYRVPCPWIQVKLLRLLQYYPPSGMSIFVPVYYMFGSNLEQQTIAMYARSSVSPCSRSCMTPWMHPKMSSRTMPRTQYCSRQSIYSSTLTPNIVSCCKSQLVWVNTFSPGRPTSGTWVWRP